ncbi:MAG: class I SAM-dependent methyltransferase [Candidatus Thiodiazotropha sp. (ex Lucinoma borealis)]|nr:class I SAM-dependent methyltransferase [Candidatus Thiodiazotropha sp. (ex Lucinoma borealis)]
MSQVTSGFRFVLSVPYVYELFQKIMGAEKARKRFISDYIDGYQVKNILDIGCGPADIVEYLSDVDYYGFDISDAYINNAKLRFGERGKFYAKSIALDDLDNLPKFDLVIMHGLLHHIDDVTAAKLLGIAWEALDQAGRLVTVDGCLVEGQNPIARYLIKHDRGQNIKTEDGYRNLVSTIFDDVESKVHHQSWVPYTLCYMECRRGKGDKKGVISNAKSSPDFT